MIYSSDEEEVQEPTAEEAEASEEEEPALIGLCTDINEESMKEIVLSLLTLNGSRIRPHEDDDEELQDIEFFISSNGGSVNDMFAIYDVMGLVKNKRDIATFGYGRVASAAVVLLAGGTKGKRHIAKNARLMIPHCSSDLGGSHPTIRSSFAELKKVEAMMIQTLAENSDLSVGEYYNIFSKNTDEYFSAEEALEMGLVDKII
jgi:ATP-dependent Clp endopeptidase proteolytic subunit ClpP